MSRLAIYNDFEEVRTHLEHQFLGKDVRKIIQVGKCFAVTLPKEYIEEHELKLGDLLEINFNDALHIEPVSEAEILSKLGQRSRTKQSQRRSKEVPAAT